MWNHIVQKVLIHMIGYSLVTLAIRDITGIKWAYLIPNQGYAARALVLLAKPEFFMKLQLPWILVMLCKAFKLGGGERHRLLKLQKQFD